jgi:SagB-type dehydrogenase family enzyme
MRPHHLKRTLAFLVAAGGLILIIFMILSDNLLESRMRMNPHQRADIMLPHPDFSSNTPVEAALKIRRSIRSYQNSPVTMQEVGQLLWAAQGITSEQGYRTAPSAGALYPLEVYVAAVNVENLPAGIYHYIPQRHALAKITDGNPRDAISKAALHQEAANTSAVNIVITASFARTTHKYGERGERFVYMEAGHAAENIYLQAVALNLGTVAIGAIDEMLTRKALHIANDEAPLYIMPVGKPV